ncbi:MAG: hypothetical protein AAB692_05475 [Patescibacteria group bacterium]
MSDDIISEFQIRANRSNVMLCGGMLIAVALTHGLGISAGFNPVWIAVVAAVTVVFAFGHHGRSLADRIWVFIGLGIGAGSAIVVTAVGLLGAGIQWLVAFIVLASATDAVAMGVLGAFGTRNARFAIALAMNAVCLAIWLAADPAVSFGAAPLTLAAMLVYWYWPVRLPPEQPPPSDP